MTWERVTQLLPNFLLVSVQEEELYAPSRLQEMESELAAKNMVVEELSRELEEIRATFGAEGVQQVLGHSPVSFIH